jgi:hypothetical protein
MVEVVFSDAEKGIMKRGIEIAANTRPPAQKDSDAAPAETGRSRGEGRLAGKPEDVAGLSFALDIGDVASSVTASSRRALFTRMFTADPWDELHEAGDSIDRYWNACTADLDKLITRAKAGEPIRIWYSDAPYSLCGFYNAIDQIEGCECPVSAVKLPLHMPMGEQGVKTARAWGEICPEELICYLPLETEIPVSVRRAVSAEWKSIKRESAPFRAVVNGKLHNVGADFYDGFIRKEIPQGPFKVAQLIGYVLGRNQLGIGDWPIAERIRKMIEAGELSIIEKNAAFYGTTLRRARQDPHPRRDLRI